MTEAVRKKLNDSAPIRWTALLLISITMFSSYYFYDIFSAIKATLQAQLGIDNSQYGAYYGAYSLLNAFGMALLGGIILDKWGIRKTGSVFISFVFFGVFMTAYGASDLFRQGGVGYSFFNSEFFLPQYSPELKMMIIGRVLFGLGAETFYVVINKIIAKWFKGHELAFAFALSLAFGRFGTAAVLVLSPEIVANASSWDMAGWFGAMLGFASLISFIFYLIMDFRLDKSIEDASDDAAPEEEFHLSDVLDLFKNRAFIYITMLCVTFYSAVFPFMGYTADFLVNKFHFTEQLAGRVTTILPFGTILFTPLFGWFTDKKGKNASVMIAGSFILILVFLMFSLTSILPYIPLFLLGVAFSLVPAAMWPSVARIVDQNKLGTAYGIMFSIQNWGLMLFPWIIGLVLDATNKGRPEGAPLDYTYAIVMLTGLGGLGLLFSFLLKRENARAGFGLEEPNRAD